MNDIDILEVDNGDKSTISNMVSQAKTVINCVGPVSILICYQMSTQQCLLYMETWNIIVLQHYTLFIISYI